MILGSALLSGGLLSGATTSIMASERADLPRVIVIGAGFGGLACAYELASAGYQVQVFEARDRVGGRIHSLHDLIEGKNVEAGGELLGSNHPTIMAYAAKFGFEFLEIKDHSEMPSPTILDGRKLDADQVKKLDEEIEKAEALLNKEAEQVDEDEPWNTPDAKALDKRTVAQWISELDISPLAKKLMSVEYAGTNGVATELQSYLGLLTVVKGGGLEKYWTDTEVFRLSGGNQQIAKRLAEELGKGRVTLNCPIASVTKTDKGMLVVDSKGRKYTADDVVLAVPPSVWSKIKFTPTLPEKLKPQIGTNTKYLAVVDEAFWESDNLPPSATSDTAITQVWHGTDGQEDAGELALIAFTGGPPAQENHKRAPDQQDAEFSKAYTALFPNFEKHFVKGKFVDWMAESWTGGGYSFPAPGEITTLGPIIRNGIGRLHFAGEHACYKFVGYAEGALNAGVALAKRLAERDGV
jgi:monoamine oxidase